MELIPAREAFQVFSVGLSAIEETTNGIKKSLSDKKVAAAKVQAKKKLAATRLLNAKKKSDKEKQLERSKPLAPIGSTMKQASKSMWERIRDAVGALLVGFLLDKLPKLFRKVMAAVKVIQEGWKFVTNLISNIAKVAKETADVAVAFVANMKDLDFTDASGRIKKEYEEMAAAIDKTRSDWEKDLDATKTAINEFQKDDSTFKKLQSEVKKNYGDELIVGEKQENLSLATTSGIHEESGVDYRPILDIIGTSETGTHGENAYGAVGKEDHNQEILGMTLADVQNASGLLGNTGEYGRYGLTPDQITKAAGLADLDLNKDTFSKENQDKMVLALLMSAGINADMISNESAKASFEMGKIFDGIPILIDKNRMEKAGIEQDDDITVTSSQLSDAFSQFQSQNSNETVDSKKVFEQKGGSANDNLKDANSTGGIVEYITGDRSHSNYREDHGGANYHEHLAFSSTALRDKAMSLLQNKGYTIGSINDGQHAKGSYHYTDQAFDIPFYPNAQNLGYSDDRKGEEQFSKDVRDCLKKAGLHGAGIKPFTGSLHSVVPINVDKDNLKKNNETIVINIPGEKLVITPQSQKKQAIATELFDQKVDTARTIREYEKFMKLIAT